MAHVKNGHLAASPEWWKHLRPWVKRRFWKLHWRAERKDMASRQAELAAP